MGSRGPSGPDDARRSGTARSARRPTRRTVRPRADDRRVGVSVAGLPDAPMLVADRHFLERVVPHTTGRPITGHQGVLVLLSGHDARRQLPSARQRHARGSKREGHSQQRGTPRHPGATTHRRGVRRLLRSGRTDRVDGTHTEARRSATTRTPADAARRVRRRRRTRHSGPTSGTSPSQRSRPPASPTGTPHVGARARYVVARSVRPSAAPARGRSGRALGPPLDVARLSCTPRVRPPAP